MVTVSVVYRGNKEAVKVNAFHKFMKYQMTCRFRFYVNAGFFYRLHHSADQISLARSCTYTSCQQRISKAVCYWPSALTIMCSALTSFTDYLVDLYVAVKVAVDAGVKNYAQQRKKREN